jgi:hypothetical protein
MKYFDIDLFFAVFPIIMVFTALYFFGGTIFSVVLVILSWPFALYAGISFGMWHDKYL